jgi:hypothetical protein
MPYLTLFEIFGAINIPNGVSNFCPPAKISLFFDPCAMWQLLQPAARYIYSPLVRSEFLREYPIGFDGFGSVTTKYSMNPKVMMQSVDMIIFTFILENYWLEIP